MSPLTPFIILLAGSLSVLAVLPEGRQQSDRAESTVLSTARAALSGYAASYPDRVNPIYGPGYLPCPARDARGISGPACADGTGSTLGRLPWHTLRISEHRDRSGTSLWYALSEAHRYNPKLEPLNGDTSTTLQFDGRPSAAILFAPGAPLKGQTARRREPADPLQFIEQQHASEATHRYRSGRGNDRMLALGAEQLMRAVVKRVLGETVQVLRRYRAANDGALPRLCAWPAGCGVVTAGVQPQRGSLAVHHRTRDSESAVSRYRSQARLSWQLSGELRLQGVDGAEPWLLECLRVSGCREGSVLYGVAECEWWAPSGEHYAPRDAARCVFTASVWRSGRQLTYEVAFAVVDDDSATVEITGGSRTRQVRTTRLSALGAETECFVQIGLSVASAVEGDGRLSVQRAFGTDGFLHVAGLRYDLDVEAGELPAWFVRNGWHERVFVAYGACEEETDCVAVRRVPLNGAARTLRVPAVLIAAAGRSPPTTTPDSPADPSVRLAPANRRALLDEQGEFLSAPRAADFSDQVRILTQLP